MSCPSSVSLTNHSSIQSLQFEWVYPQWAALNHGDAFAPLRNTLYHQQEILAYCIRWEHLWAWKTLFSLPTHKGGLGICDPVESAQHFHSASVKGTARTVSSIRAKRSSLCWNIQWLWRARQNWWNIRRIGWIEQDQRKLETALEQMDNRSRCVAMRAVDGKTSGWLNVLPIARHQFDLSAQRHNEVRHALGDIAALTYRWWGNQWWERQMRPVEFQPL